MVNKVNFLIEKLYISNTFNDLLIEIQKPVVLIEPINK